MQSKIEGKDEIMKKCPICEKIYNDYDQYCLKCNYKLQVIKDFKKEDYLPKSHISATASNIKKPFYKKWWFYLIASIILFVSIFASNDETPNSIENNNKVVDVDITSQSITTNVESDNSIKMLKPENYDGPECWLLYQNNSIIEVYADINNKVDGLKDKCKMVFKMLNK